MQCGKSTIKISKRENAKIIHKTEKKRKQLITGTVTQW